MKRRRDEERGRQRETDGVGRRQRETGVDRGRQRETEGDRRNPNPRRRKRRIDGTGRTGGRRRAGTRSRHGPGKADSQAAGWAGGRVGWQQENLNKRSHRSTDPPGNLWEVGSHTRNPLLRTGLRRRAASRSRAAWPHRQASQQSAGGTGGVLTALCAGTEPPPSAPVPPMRPREAARPATLSWSRGQHTLPHMAVSSRT